ncbi:MAG: ABC transporter permease [Firmicutes bacterium]|nr:ABC transporter permease [Bacillota bacterium]
MSTRSAPTILGLCFVFFLFGLAIFAPLLATYCPYSVELERALRPPCPEHFFGTDRLGRDIFSRVLFGARVSLAVGVLSMLLAIGIGTSIGAVAGYYRGITEAALMRLTDIVLAFPTFFLILLLVAFFEPDFWLVIAVIGGTGWPATARLVRAEFLRLREADFVAAARLLSASDARIILRHLLPNALGPVLVSATLSVPAAILTEAGLGYFGLGVQPAVPTWGNMLREAQNYFRHAWWYATFPGVFIFLTVFSFHLLADGLRQQLNPGRWRGRLLA